MPSFPARSASYPWWCSGRWATLILIFGRPGGRSNNESFHTAFQGAQFADEQWHGRGVTSGSMTSCARRPWWRTWSSWPRVRPRPRPSNAATAKFRGLGSKPPRQALARRWNCASCGCSNNMASSLKNKFPCHHATDFRPFPSPTLPFLPGAWPSMLLFVGRRPFESFILPYEPQRLGLFVWRV